MDKQRIKTIMDASYTDTLVKPTVERMNLKECLNAQRKVDDVETKALIMMFIGYFVIGIVSAVIFGWVWIMDYIGWFPYVPSHEEMIVPLALFTPIAVAMGYNLHTFNVKVLIRRRIRVIAESEAVDDE